MQQATTPSAEPVNYTRNMLSTPLWEAEQAEGSEQEQPQWQHSALIRDPIFESQLHQIVATDKEAKEAFASVMQTSNTQQVLNSMGYT